MDFCHFHPKGWRASLGQGCIFSIDEIIYNARKNYEYTTAHWRGSKVAWHHPKNYTLLSQGGFAGRTAAHRKRLPALFSRGPAATATHSSSAGTRSVPQADQDTPR